MRNITPPRWALSENLVTPEDVFLNRRQWLRGAGFMGAMAALSPVALAATPGEGWSPTAATNPKYADPGRPVTPEDVNTTYNNFYEFGSHKQIYNDAQALDTTGWEIKIDGMVEKEMTIGVEDLIAKMPIEERVYRHRCVEAWSMVVPWIGFTLPELVKLAAPTSGAKYVQFQTFMDPETARGQRQHWYPWPYTEGVTMAEAMNDLSLMVVGAYGKVLHKPFGAPIRLHLPWKYGFKHIKSIDRITFTDKRPVSFWEELQAKEYGFWANVNPEVPHPRWSQASEKVLGTQDRIPTLLFNGYGEEVAGLYTDIDEGDRLWR
ncbi:MAG: protein-methionine-sulfoxide reductase catalytic subunit MsrP [Pseudomonadota bacterium]